MRKAYRTRCFPGLTLTIPRSKAELPCYQLEGHCSVDVSRQRMAQLITNIRKAIRARQASR